MRWLVLLLLVLPSTLHAETWLITFTDLESCPYCVQLDRVAKSRPVLTKLAAKGYTVVEVDVKTLTPNTLRKWKVDSWPQLFLVEVVDNKAIRLINHKTGSMNQSEYIRFLK